MAQRVTRRVETAETDVWLTGHVNAVRVGARGQTDVAVDGRFVSTSHLKGFAVIRRIVMFQKKADVGAEEFTEVLTDLQTLDQRMTGMSSWWVDINPERDGLWDAVLIGEFADSDAVAAYDVHPEHAAVVSRIGGVASVAIYDAGV